jgi:GxxExxY protein
MSGLLYAEQTHVLRGLIFDVRNQLKAGWSEEIYHLGLLRALQDERIPVLHKPRRPLLHRGVEVHLFEPDLIVWDLIVLELKALPYVNKFDSTHLAQILHYLKFFEKQLGLLVNFAPRQVNIQRVLWEKSSPEIEESYRGFSRHLAPIDRKTLRQMREILLAIATQYGLGYPEGVYRQIIAIELQHHGLSCQSDVIVPARWNGVKLSDYASNVLLVEDRYLIHVRAMLEHPGLYDYTRVKTYLANLELQFGIVVNFGGKRFQIHGVVNQD